MSKYLGFEPSDSSLYCFISYNSEDADRVGSIVKGLQHSGINCWYDKGIEYGEAWETKITKKIRNAHVLLLFITKGIFSKDKSYVVKEYKIADTIGVKIVPVILDRINKEDVPDDKLSWWLDIKEIQSVNAIDHEDTPTLLDDIVTVLGMNSSKNKMNIIVEQYTKLYENGDLTEAESLLQEYLHTAKLSGKVEFILHLINGDIDNVGFLLQGEEYSEHTDIVRNFFECQRITVDSSEFLIGMIVHGPTGYGDAQHVIIYRNGEYIYNSFNIEGELKKVVWDKNEDIIYIYYIALEREEDIDGRKIAYFAWDALTIEDPCGNAVCNSFKTIEKAQ